MTYKKNLDFISKSSTHIKMCVEDFEIKLDNFQNNNQNLNKTLSYINLALLLNIYS